MADFDPDAYLAKKGITTDTKPKTSGFDPDAYLKKKGIEQVKPEKEQSTAEKVTNPLGFVGGNINTEIIAPTLGALGDVGRNVVNQFREAGNAIRPPGKPEVPMLDAKNTVGTTENIKEGMNKVGLVPESAIPTSSGGRLAQTAIGLAPLLTAAPSAYRGAVNTVSKIPQYFNEARGIRVPQAQEQAIKGIQSGIQSGIESQGVPKINEIKNNTDIGSELRKNYNDAMEESEAIKKNVGNEMYAKLNKEASEYASITGKRMYDPSGKPISMEENIQKMKDEEKIGNSKKGDYSDERVREAKKTAAAIRKQINDYSAGFETPYSKVASEFGEAASATDVKGTALGKKFGTEGGLDRDLYGKTSDEDLGASVFKNEESIKRYEDALAGGKNATPASRLEARKKVTELLEAHLKSSLAESTPEQIAKHVAAPKNQGFYSYAPKVQANIEQFGKQKLAEEFNNDLQNFNKTFGNGEKSQLPEAIKEGQKLLRSANNRGLINNDQYNQINQMIARADTEQERTKLVRKALGMIGLSLGGYETLKHL